MIYLDHNATTPPAPEVLAAMKPFFRECWGNPASLHRFGTKVARHLDTARAAVACLIGADASEIVFTSGGTESNNLAIHGAWQASAHARLITSRVEHPSVQEVCRAVAMTAPGPARGARPSLDEQNREGGVARRRAALTELPVDHAGRLDLDALQAALTPRPALVSLMWANNETGVLFPLAEIARLTHRAGATLHTDAVQAAGRVPIDVRAVPVDLMSLSAHKLNGPKGIGALYVRRGTKLAPLLLGGGQEQGLRGGTPNVPAIVGFGAACTLAQRRLADMYQVAALRDRLERGLLEKCPGALVNGDRDQRLPNTLNIRFPGVAGESLLMRLDDAGIAVSTGAACSSGKHEPSHVILAMGAPARDAAASIRFSLGPTTTDAEIAQTIAQTTAALLAIRGR